MAGSGGTHLMWGFRGLVCPPAQLSPAGQRARLPAPPGPPVHAPGRRIQHGPQPPAQGLPEPRDSHVLLLGLRGLVVRGCGLEQVACLMLKGGRAVLGQPGLAWG